MPKLIFTSPQFAGRVQELTSEKVAVGRAHDNALTLADASVSDHHCELLINGIEVIVRDLASTNGTFVDDVRVDKQYPVRNGQRLRFGVVETRLELGLADLGKSDQTSTDVTAIHAWKRFSEKPPEPPAPSPHDTIVPISGAPAETAHTMVVPRAPQAAPAQPASEPQSEPSKRGLLLAVVAIVLAVAAACYFLIYRR